jgi:hypothetical protein
MRKKNISVFAVLAALLQSCIVVESTGNRYTVNSEYSRLSDEEKQKVIFTDTSASVCKPEKDDKIYAITGNQLRNCIEAEEKAMVHIWLPYGAGYYPLSYLQSYCNSRGITLHVVAKIYGNIRVMYYEQTTVSAPLFSINEQYYGTPGRGNKYLNLFIDELIQGTNLTSEQLLGVDKSRFLFFDNGKLTSFSDSLE